MKRVHVVFYHGPLKPGQSRVFTLPSKTEEASAKYPPLVPGQVQLVGEGPNLSAIPPRR